MKGERVNCRKYATEMKNDKAQMRGGEKRADDSIVLKKKKEARQRTKGKENRVKKGIAVLAGQKKHKIAFYWTKNTRKFVYVRFFLYLCTLFVGKG